MRKLIYHVATTVDGYISHLDGSFDGFVPEGDHVADYYASFADYGAVLMGRATYEVGLREGITNPYPTMQSFVFSRTMASSPDPAVELVRDNATAFVAELKQAPGKDIYLCGGADLAAQMLDANLVDEVKVKLNGALFGQGLPVVRPLQSRRDLKLRDHKVYTSGVVLLRYQVQA